MSIVKITLAVAFVCVSFTAGIYAAGIKTDSQQALDACARENNVYECKWVAQPAQEPTVVYKQAELLPPPSGLGL